MLRRAAASTFGELLGHPCLAGVGPLLLPREDRPPDPALPLARLAPLLPYHAHVDPQAVVRGVNRLLEEAAAGAPPAYRFYPEQAMRQDPSRAGTGLFLLRGRPGAPFAVICPGGGSSTWPRFTKDCRWQRRSARLGYNALVLKYRVGSGGAAAAEDLAAALAWIFRHAGRLGLGTEGYSLWGFSAGARMAAAIATHGTARWGAPPLRKPAAVVIAYTGHQETGADEPPAFVVSGELDGIAPPAVMQRRVESLRRLGVPVEFRVFPRAAHGFGLGAGTAAEGWVEEAVRFWERMRKHSRKESR